MTIAVVLGQIYVGSGYRQMSSSILELIEQINDNSHTNDATTKLAELL